MNIAIITPEIPYPDNSGGRKYTLERIKMLRKNLNNIFLYSVVDNDVPTESISELNKYCSKVSVYLRNKNKLRSLVHINKPYSALTRFNNNLVNDLEKDIKEKQIDILIIDIPQLMYNIPEKCDIPIVLTQHNIEYKTFFDIGKNTRSLIKKASFYFEGIKLKRYEESFYKKNMIGLYTFISEKDKCIFEDKYVGKTILIPMGIKSEYKQLTVDRNNNDRKIVFVGKMNYFPNEEASKWFCGKIFPEILKKSPNTKLYLVGKEPTKEVLDLKSESVVVTGTVSDVNSYIDMANIIVIPLLSGGGVKIKLLEALSRGKIVITTEKGIEGTEFKHNEHVLVAKDENEFINMCLMALEDNEKYEFLVKNSFEAIKKNYGYDSIGEKYNNCLKELVKDRYFNIDKK